MKIVSISMALNSNYESTNNPLCLPDKGIAPTLKGASLVRRNSISLPSYNTMKRKTKPARNKQTDSFPLVACAVKGIEEKKGNEIVCLNLKKNLNAPCDYFVICEANSRTQVQAIAGSVEEFVKKETGNRPWHVEGMQNAEWVLLDYVDVVVHIFQPHIRQHFGLEDMWADAEVHDMKAKDSPVKKKVIAKVKAKAKTKKPVKTKASPKKKTIKKPVKRKK